MIKDNHLFVSDLHMHSSYSDGYWSPAEVILRAKDAGLTQVSLTDHNTILGLSEAEKAAKEVGLNFINGVEINAQSEYYNEQFHNHILAYSFNKKRMSNALNKIIKSNNLEFSKTIIKLRNIIKSGETFFVEKRTPLLKFKKDINYKKINEKTILKDEYFRLYNRLLSDRDIKKLKTSVSLTPETISRFIKNNLLEDSITLVQKEPRFWAKKIIFANLPEVFNSIEKNYYKDHISVLNIIQQSAGISIIAHPFLEYKMFSEHKKMVYKKFLNYLIDNCMNGFEIYYYIGQGFSEKEQQEYNTIITEIAQKNNLVLTYGSDCHGPKRQDQSRIYLGKFGSNHLIKFN